MNYQTIWMQLESGYWVLERSCPEDYIKRVNLLEEYSKKFYGRLDKDFPQGFNPNGRIDDIVKTREQITAKG